jgi:pimeloyl-ACP methyl ester carboxylesterase
MGEVRPDSKQIPSHWFEGMVVANGIRQHYYRTGGDHRSLILLHGFTDNGLSWLRVARALERDYDVVMVDGRGLGLSDGPETGYSQDLLSQDVMGLIHILMGHSNGALTAASVAANEPELVSAVVLEDPPWGNHLCSSLCQRTGKNPGRGSLPGTMGGLRGIRRLEARR